MPLGRRMNWWKSVPCVAMHTGSDPASLELVEPALLVAFGGLVLHRVPCLFSFPLKLCVRLGR